jgi:hypothetical protein
VAGGGFKNAMYEMGHSALKGGATGLAGGAMMAAMKQDASYLWKGAAMGAALSTGIAGLRIASMGPLFIPDSKYGTLEDFGQVYRSGSIFTAKGAGAAIGNNVVAKLTGNVRYDKYLLDHEVGHMSQINDMGITKFYVRTAKEYMKYGLSKVYSTLDTLEYGAEYYSFEKLGYYYDNMGIRYSFP